MKPFKLRNVKKFVIDRKKWLHGEGAEVSKLLREYDKKMCCLGFYCEALGHKRKYLNGLSAPQELNNRFDTKSLVPKWLIGRGMHISASNDTASLMTINDSERISNERREKGITKIFAKHGVEVVFKGKY